MIDYISREFVLKCMEDSYKSAGISAEAKAKMTRWLNKAPAADVREVKRGKWIYDSWCKFRCSECRALSKSEPAGRENFCPNCGADMRGEADGTY